MIFHKSLKYLAYLMLLLGVSACCFYINSSIQKTVAETYDYSNYIFILTFLYVPIGICLGLPQLMKEMNKEGKWKMNITKLIFLGIPAIYFSGYLYIHYHFTFLNLWNEIAVELLQLKTSIIANIILGYILSTSFHK